MRDGIWSPAAAILLLALALAAGCAGEGRRDSPNGGPTGSVSSPIQGGVDTQEFPYAVGICVGSGGGPGICNTICSGALIAPNMVMTSRHCVDQAPDTVIDCTKDVFGPPRAPPENIWVTTFSNIMQTTRAWHQGRRLITTPGTSFCGRDIAVIVLKDLVPSSETPLVIPVVDTVTNHDLYGSQIAAVGYGATTPSGADFGTRRVLRDVPIRCIPGDPNLECGSGEVDSYHVYPNEFVSGRGICFGDSGSSAFSQSELDNGRARSLGVLSRGLETNTSCELGIYTRTDKWRGFLTYAAQTASEIGSYPSPDWAKGYDAGTPYAPRSLGTPCYEAEACDSQLCGSADGERSFYCTQSCDPAGGATVCPEGFRCAPGTEAGLCFPSTPSSAPSGPGCSCDVPGARRALPVGPIGAGGALLAVLAVARRRRRSATPSSRPGRHDHFDSRRRGW